jgi:hypothetical protein
VKTGELLAMRNATLAKSVRGGSLRGEGVARSLEAMTTSFYRELLGAGILSFAQGSTGLAPTASLSLADSLLLLGSRASVPIS